jgi:hypothetical protein
MTSSPEIGGVVLRLFVVQLSLFCSWSCRERSALAIICDTIWIVWDTRKSFLLLRDFRVRGIFPRKCYLKSSPIQLHSWCKFHLPPAHTVLQQTQREVVDGGPDTTRLSHPWCVRLNGEGGQPRRTICVWL